MADYDLRASRPMIEALEALGPLSPLREELMQFGRFVGGWDLNVTYFAADGAVIRCTPGEWLFGWVLEGRAIQDVWIVPPRAERSGTWPAPGEYGVTLRFYDPALGAWRSTWHGPVNGVVFPFIARQIDDEMVLERTDDDGAIIRWIFSKIEESSFHWRAVRSTDEGQTWTLEQVMLATRQISDA